MREGGDALHEHALFEALHAERPGNWVDWPAGWRQGDAAAVRYHLFLQWIAARSFAAAQTAARAAGMRIGLISDLAIGMDRAGSHAWARQSDLLLGLSIGAPPDAFNPRGQDWGLTGFSPRALVASGFEPFLATLRAALRHAGGVRIDHVMGLMRLWLIPRGAPASEGAYLAYPLEDLLRLLALESHRHGAVVIGEDLGTVPPGFRARLRRAGIAGMDVLWFERTRLSFKKPSRWRRDAVAMTTTHDLPTVAGWWSGADIRTRRALGLGAAGEEEERKQDRGRLWRAFTAAGTVQGAPPPVDRPAAAVDAALGYVAQSPSPLMLAPLEDPAGARRAAQPAGHDRRASQLAPPPRPRGQGPVRRARGRGPRQDHRRPSPMIPRATLRLQFHRGFTFADAEALVPYFARLGVSHLYASPIAVARPGSLHGYDVIDPTRVNPELGGEAGLRSLAAAARGAASGLIVDIVPNHMAADPANAWWADVLRHGRASRYARFFDIDWEADGKVLLPILGKPLEETLAAGEIEVGREELRYFSHRLPLTPGEPACLSDVLARQHYRLAWWRTAGDRINWRRFFDINELVCLRMDEPAAFEAVHALPLRLYAEGLLDGLRVDHVDGLADPAAYCRTLRQRLGKDAYLVVEKILLRGETLPSDWDCDGTTGYDFMNDVSALQHDAAGEACLAEAWSSLSGRPADFAPEEQAARREIVARSFSAQLEACAAALPPSAIARPTCAACSPSCWRISRSIAPTVPAARCWSAPMARCCSVPPRARARPASPPIAGPSIAVLRLLATPSGNARGLVRFQQLSAPVAAKAVEDTAFYRYGRLLSRNDVGFDVETFASDATAFHARDAPRAAGHPQAMLATATHDHKRGEDVRARLAVLERAWPANGPRCRRAGSRPVHRFAPPARPMPATSPCCCRPSSAPGRSISMPAMAPARTAFAERLAAWQQKALREAKLFSDWAAVDETYEDAARRFTLALIAEAALPDLLQEIATLVRRIAAAGAVNGLVQCLLRLTVPGVPDLYQGTEFWDFSLVDPDNRRPVDFSRARRAWAMPTCPALPRSGAMAGSSRP